MKVFKKIVFIIIVVFIIMSIFKFLKKEHKIDYKINNYTINEHFYISKNHYYDFIIKNKKDTYVYTLDKNLNKKKKLIKDIKSYRNGNLKCIIPVYKKNINKSIYCNLNNQQVSVDYLLKSSNKDYENILEKVKKYKIKTNKDYKNKKRYKKLFVYQKNILDNHVYFIWDYKGIYVIDNKDIKYRKILDYDLYDNVMDCIVDKYYVLFENQSVNGIEKVNYYDIKRDKVGQFKLKIKLSKDSYINGVVNNFIYVTDKRQKREYKISISKKSIVEVDNDQTAYLVYDNYNKKTLNKSDYFMNDIYFNNNFIVDNDVTDSKELKKEYNYYYFIKDNNLYKALDSNKKHSILLASMNDIKNWVVKDREILLLEDDTLYSYSDDFGLRKVLVTNELKYNYKNIYDLWKE